MGNMENSNIKNMENNNMKKFALLAISILIIAVSGCVNDGSKSVPTQTPSVPTETENATIVPTVTSVPLPEDTGVTISESENGTLVDKDVNATIVTGDINETVPEDGNGTSSNIEGVDPTIKTYGVGETIDDGTTKVTLNSIRYTDTIGDKSPGYNIAKPNPGYKFAIVNITIENIGKGMNISYDESKFVILPNDATSERSYEYDTVSSEGWTKRINGNDIIPGDIRQGELVFQIPENAGGLELKFEYYSESPDGTTLGYFKLA